MTILYLLLGVAIFWLLLAMTSAADRV